MIASGVPIIFNSAQLSADVVLTGNVKDGELVNADFNNAAAIAWSKISKVASRISDLASHDINDTDTTLGVPKGGTGLTTIAAHNIIVGADTGNVVPITPDTIGKVLTSNGVGADPSFQSPAAGTVYATDASGTDAYVMTPTQAVAAYVLGMLFMFQAMTANTTDATLAVSGLAALPLLKKGNTALASNDIKAGDIVLAAYNEVPCVMDSYSESNISRTDVFSTTLYGVAQTFRPASSGILSQAKFYINKVGNPVGNMYAKIYAVTGTPGTTGKPTGAALAVSDAKAASSVLGNSVQAFTFSGANKISLNSGTDYCVTLEYTGGNGGNTVQVVGDDTSPTDNGNYASADQTMTWTANGGVDECFYVMGGTPQFNMLSQISN
jgi:hypothetical protein